MSYVTAFDTCLGGCPGSLDFEKDQEQGIANLSRLCLQVHNDLNC